MRITLHIFLALAILGLGYWGFEKFLNPEISNKVVGKFNNESKAAKGGNKKSEPSVRKKRPVLQVHAEMLEPIDFTVEIETQGEIRTHNSTEITPQVGGKVEWISDKFQDGAFFKKNDVLVRLDQADFKTDVASAKAQLARAEASYAQEKARAEQALLNWKDVGFDEEPSELVLRKPQLREAEATVASAQANFEDAKRKLDLTEVLAPYDGRVRKRNIGLGQQVGGSTSLGEVFSTDFAEVRLPLSTRDLTYYTPPRQDSDTKQLVKFQSILAEDNVTWEGQILRTEGELDEKSRQLFVIAKIDDPFSLKSGAQTLYIGQPLRAFIPAKVFKNTYVVQRENMSGLNEILIVRDGKLKRLQVNPIWSDRKKIILREEIEPGDQLITSNIRFVPEGAPVEVISESGADDNIENKSRKSSVSRREARAVRAQR